MKYSLCFSEGKQQPKQSAHEQCEVINEQLYNKHMIDNSKRSGNYLLGIFIAGIVFGCFDKNIGTDDRYNIGYLIGSGLGILLMSMLFGYIVHLIVLVIQKILKSTTNEVLLDANAEMEERQLLEEAAKLKLRPFKIGMCMALFFAALRILSSLG